MPSLTPAASTVSTPLETAALLNRTQPLLLGGRI